MKKQLGYANLCWLFLFFSEYGITLFQVSNEQYLTLMGLYINNIDKRNSLLNIFALSTRAFIVYLGIVIGWMLLYVVGKRFVFKKKTS